MLATEHVKSVNRRVEGMGLSLFWALGFNTEGKCRFGLQPKYSKLGYTLTTNKRS